MNVLIWEIKCGMGFAEPYEERQASFYLYPPQEGRIYIMAAFFTAFILPWLSLSALTPKGADIDGRKDILINFSIKDVLVYKF